jgi:mRNA interferase RelE/StbE
LKYFVDLSPLAEKQVRKIRNGELQQRLLTAMTELGVDPRPQGTKRMVSNPFWRIRVGDWRIVYEIQDDVLVVVVVTLGIRGDVYEKLKR